MVGFSRNKFFLNSLLETILPYTDGVAMTRTKI